MLSRPPILPLVSAVWLAGVGCSSAVRKPQLLHPGPAPFQRANAEVIDPFPLPDMGPEIVGGRPREFAQPRNEVERAQEYKRSLGIRPGAEVPLAPIPAGPPVAITPAYPAPAYPTPSYPPPATPTVPSVPRY